MTLNQWVLMGWCLFAVNAVIGLVFLGAGVVCVRNGAWFLVLLAAFGVVILAYLNISIVTNIRNHQ